MGSSQSIYNYIDNNDLKNVEKLISTNPKNMNIPFCYSCKKGSLDIIKLFISKGIDINCLTNQKNNIVGRYQFENSYYYMPLNKAIERGDLEIIKYLVSNGAIITQKHINLCQDKEILNFLKNK